MPAAGRASLREEILARYDRCRAVSTMQQSSLLAKQLWATSVAPIAVRLGLVDTEAEAVTRDLDAFPTAADLALYTPDREGSSAVSCHAAEGRERLTDQERQVLDALLSGEHFWVVDGGLEANAPAGMELALRLFRPEDLSMTTGAAVAMNAAIWQGLERMGLMRRPALAIANTPDPDALAEAIYRLAGR